MDRDRYAPTLFLAAWPGLEDFLGARSCPGLSYRPLRIREPGTSFSSRHSDSPSVDNRFGNLAAASRFQKLYWRLGAPARPFIDGAVYPAMKFLRLAPDAGRIARALHRNRVDVLHIVNGGYPGAYSARAAAVAGMKLGIPVVMTVCSTAMPLSATFRPLESRLDGLVRKAVASFIVPAARPGRALVDRRGFNPTQIREIPWGLRAPLPGDHRSVAKDEARVQLGLPRDVQIVGTLSRMVPEKGHGVLLEAMARLQDHAAPVHTLLGGAGPDRSALEARAADLGLAERVSFTGQVEDRFAFLRALDVFVLASDIEGLPYVVLEAMSQGIPVVATDVGGLDTAIIQGESGFLVPVRDSNALAERVRFLLDHPAESTAMGRSGNAMYNRRFTLESMLTEHESTYAEVLRRRES